MMGAVNGAQVNLIHEKNVVSYRHDCYIHEITEEQECENTLTAALN